MQEQHEWLLDLAKVSTESEPPAAQDTARTKVPKSAKNSVQRSPVQVLVQLAFLKDLHHAQIQKILKLCTVGSYEPDEEVCAVDSPSDEMYILISGELGVLTKDGSQVLTINPVMTVGELGFITNYQRPVGLKATTASKVLCISRSQFDRLLRSDTDMQVKVYRNIIAILSNRFIRLRDLVEGALTRPNELREGS